MKGVKTAYFTNLLCSTLIYLKWLVLLSARDEGMGL